MNLSILRQDIDVLRLYSIENKYVYSYSKTATFDFKKDDAFINEEWFKKVIEYDGKILAQVGANQEGGHYTFKDFFCL